MAATTSATTGSWKCRGDAGSRPWIQGTRKIRLSVPHLYVCLGFLDTGDVFRCSAK